MNKKLLGAVLVAVLIAFGGYFLFSRLHSSKMKEMVPPQQKSEGHPAVKAPGFTLKTLDGKTISLEDFKGKAVVLNFFATWCPPCRAETPSFVSVYNRYRDKGLVVVGISMDNDPEEALPPFIKEFSIPYPVAIGTRQVAQEYGGVQSIPTTFFIDREGNLKNYHLGLLSEAALERRVKELL
ncbi:MAG: TlpA family protein disulfide reductase [Deltaproteobacteria bacterium]|nr:MAG: TlpA family protein disulfide reductase [Deltaproteobacteria bacterium]